jgi:hypothetical protein
MARPRKTNPILTAARNYFDRHVPELKGAQLHVRQLDGPPGSARFAVTAEACCPDRCPRGVPTEVAQAGTCHVLNCPLRRSVRLLLDRRGDVLQVTRSGIHWN